MTKKELRKKAEKILKWARKNPELIKGMTMKEYRKFWEGKRIACCELLDIDTCIDFLEFPFPWEEQK